MTRAEFMSSEGNMALLNDILRDPIFKAALDIVKAEAYGPLPDPVPGVSYEAQVAASGAQAIGWMRAIRALESLSRPLPIPAATAVRFQQPQFVEPAKERMRKAGLYSEKEINELK
jgi:hypothetical protein